MWHERTPDEPGWYWVADDPECGEDWQMVYWDSESREPSMMTFYPDSIRVVEAFGHPVTVWKPLENGRWFDGLGWWTGPVVWVGPLGVPGGPFGNHIAEFSYETYCHAKDAGKVMVMEHQDESHSTGHGTTTVISVKPSTT